MQIKLEDKREEVLKDVFSQANSFVESESELVHNLREEIARLTNEIKKENNDLKIQIGQIRGKSSNRFNKEFTQTQCENCFQFEKACHEKQQQVNELLLKLKESQAYANKQRLENEYQKFETQRLLRLLYDEQKDRVKRPELLEILKQPELLCQVDQLLPKFEKENKPINRNEKKQTQIVSQALMLNNLQRELTRDETIKKNSDVQILGFFNFKVLHKIVQILSKYIPIE